jgi:hopene-associated glycosyltransferase HpnB
MSPETLLAGLVLAIWIYLVFMHGGFWRGLERETIPIAKPAITEIWPPVIAIVPARNEAETLPQCLASLLAQSYPGDFAIIIVDDQSDDATAEIAGNLGRGASRPVNVLRATARPEGWTGKVWAQNTGVSYAEGIAAPGTLYLMTDADIAYEPDSLAGLVRNARARGTVLTSLMVKLKCSSFAEHLLIPAFIFFFQMLYPFAHSNRRDNATAAAAGGCMLIDRAALQRAGGMATIRSALIDDCALARIMKREGPIWLGLAETVRSIRAYPHVADIRQMVARSAYAQLKYSPLLLIGCTAGMALTFLAAPALTLLGTYPANLLAVCAWLLMARAFQPTLRYYCLSPLWGVGLPIIAAMYLAFTLDSAYQHLSGRGGMWKGRSQSVQE